MIQNLHIVDLNIGIQILKNKYYKFIPYQIINIC